MKPESSYLVLSELYSIPPYGGHVVWLHEMARRLGGFCLLTGRMDGFGKVNHVDGIDIRCINLSRWPLVRPESLPLYCNFFLQSVLHARRVKPKAIIAARVVPEGIIANPLGRLIRVPSVIMAHGEEINRMRPGKTLQKRRRITSEGKRCLLWRAYKRADLVIANSQFTADLLLEGGVAKDKVAVLNLGADPERFRPEPKDAELVKRYDLDGRKVILSVGRLVIRKGQDMTIRAMPTILEKIPNAVYLIGGTGAYGTELRKLVDSLGLGSHVRFIGSIADEEMVKTFNLADVFIMANRLMKGSGDLEGFGIVFLEAGACEVPVIGGRSGGVPDAIIDGETGFLIDGNSPEPISETVIRILSDPELAERMGRNGRERVCREQSWNHVASRFGELLQGLRR